jgi:hypothetical protein
MNPSEPGKSGRKYLMVIPFKKDLILKYSDWIHGRPGTTSDPQRCTHEEELPLIRFLGKLR